MNVCGGGRHNSVCDQRCSGKGWELRSRSPEFILASPLAVFLTFSLRSLGSCIWHLLLHAKIQRIISVLLVSYFILCSCNSDISNFCKVQTPGVTPWDPGKMDWMSTLHVARSNLCYSWNSPRGFILLGATLSHGHCPQLLRPFSFQIGPVSPKHPTTTTWEQNVAGGFRGKGRDSRVLTLHCTARTIFRQDCGFPFVKFLWPFLNSGYFLLSHSCFVATIQPSFFPLNVPSIFLLPIYPCLPLSSVSSCQWSTPKIPLSS